MKKLISILITVALVLGCAGFSVADAPGEYKYKVVDGYTLVDLPDSDEKVTLTMMGWEGGPSETDNVNDALDQFSKLYPNITVEYTPGPYDDHHSKLLTMVAAGNCADVFYCGSSFYDDFAKRGVLYDITDLYGQVYTLDDYIPSALECMTYDDGRIYGISSCTVSPVLYYNKDLFDEAGMAYPPTDPANPWTWAEFVDACKKLTKKDDSGKVTQYGFYGLEDFELLTTYWNQMDIEYLSGDRKTFTATDDPNFKRVFETIKALRTEDGVSPKAAFTETSGMNNVQMLLTGMVAMFCEGSWAGEETAESGVNFGVTALPVMEGGHSASWGQAHMHSIWKDTPHLDEAWALLVFLGNEDYQRGLVQQGLWMPNRTSMYTEAGIDSWLTENHPDGFREMAQYWKDFCPIQPLTVMGNEATDTFKELTQAYFDGDEDLDKVISDMRTRIDKILASK